MDHDQLGHTYFLSHAVVRMRMLHYQEELEKGKCEVAIQIKSHAHYQDHYNGAHAFRVLRESVSI